MVMFFIYRTLKWKWKIVHSEIKHFNKENECQACGLSDRILYIKLYVTAYTYNLIEEVEEHEVTYEHNIITYFCL